MPNHRDDQLTHAQALMTEGRNAFASDVEALMTEIQVFSRLLEASFDLRTREEAWRALRRFFLEKFDQRVALRSTADPILLQLVREAFDALNDPESKVDLREWTREARKVLQRSPAEGPIDPRD